MKKHTIILLGILFSSMGNGYAQEHQFFAIQGALESTSTSYGGLNKALDQFNEASGSEFSKMSSGLAFNAALSRIWDDNGIYAGLRFTQLNAESSSLLNDEEGRLKAQQNFVSVESGFSLIQNNHFELQLGFSADWRLEKISAEGAMGTEPLFDELNGSVSPHAQGYAFLSRKIPLALFARVYYSWAFLETDYSKVYNKLLDQPITTETIDMKSRPNAFGLSVGLAIVFHQRDLSFTRSSKPSN